MGTCPICSFQVLNVLNTETGRSHKICPYCFNHPPQDLHPQQTELRCFQCAHPTCSLAGGRASGANNGNDGRGGSGSAIISYSAHGPSIAPCSNCGGYGQMLLKHQRGRWCAQCSRYPSCEALMWLPQSIVAANVAGHCAVCSARLGCEVHTLSVQITTGHDAAGLAAGSDTVRDLCIAGCTDLMARFGA